MIKCTIGYVYRERIFSCDGVLKYKLKVGLAIGCAEILNEVTVYKVSQEKCAKFREGVPYVELHRYNPKHLYPKLNSYGDNGQRSLKL